MCSNTNIRSCRPYLNAEVSCLYILNRMFHDFARLPDCLVDPTNWALGQSGMPDWPDCFKGQIARLLSEPDYQIAPQAQIGHIESRSRLARLTFH